MIEGVIDFLLSEEPEAQYIRSAAVVKIVPMANIDGVVVGNYRCSLSGCDLNRRWKNPKKKIHPEVSRIKDVLKAFTRERMVRLVCDFHGHSRK
jgi:predicted deacylase